MPGGAGDGAAGAARLDVVVVEPYHGGSHRAWLEGLGRHCRHRVVALTHEARNWRWRIRGASLTLADATADHVAAHGRPDLVVVSDMIDLAAYRGFAGRVLGDVPVVLYMHENQVAWPDGPARGPDDPAGWTNWLSMAAADAVLVSSAHHRRALEEALVPLLRSAPDHSHLDHLAAVLARTEVLHPGVELEGLVDAPRRGASGEPPLVLWNQRWDEDRDLPRLLAILCHLADDGVPFRLALAGESRWVPAEVEESIQALGERVVHRGWCAPDAYRGLLLSADVVVSVTTHEYCGIAVVEAIAAGAVPLLPAKLSYPELLPVDVADRCLYRSQPAEALRSLLEGIEEVRTDPAVGRLREAMSRWSWQSQAPRYDEAFTRLAAVEPARGAPTMRP